MQPTPHPPLPSLSRTHHDMYAEDYKQSLEGPVAARDEHLLLGPELEPTTPDCTQYYQHDDQLELSINSDPYSHPSLAQPPCKTWFWSRGYEYTEPLPWRQRLWAETLEALTHH